METDTPTNETGSYKTWSVILLTAGITVSTTLAGWALAQTVAHGETIAVLQEHADNTDEKIRAVAQQTTELDAKLDVLIKKLHGLKQAQALTNYRLAQLGKSFGVRFHDSNDDQ